jgi:thioredoxin-like negative regulator of GroEL
MEPIVDGLEAKYNPDFKIVRVDVDKSQGKALAREHGCIGQPAYVLFDRSGEQVRRLMGAQTAETFEQEIERILQQSTP